MGSVSGIEEDALVTICVERDGSAPLRLHPEDLRQLANMVSTAIVTRPASILLSEEEAREYCGGLARSTWSDYNQRGIIPEPVKVGGRNFWRRTDLDLWAAWGCPGRDVFKTRLAKSIQHKN